MGLKTIDILATLLLNLIQYGRSDHILSCNGSLLSDCLGKHQICNLVTHECDCEKGFIWIGDICGVPADEPTSHSGITIAIATLLTLALLIAGVFLIVRKYNLVDYVRQKINSRRSNDVMYEDVMIGNDDPPLSP